MMRCHTDVGPETGLVALVLRLVVVKRYGTGGLPERDVTQRGTNSQMENESARPGRVTRKRREKPSPSRRMCATVTWQQCASYLR